MSEYNIEIGFSPCPNDTFIFDALINSKIDTGRYSFTARMEDVQTLNNMAIQNVLAVSKISYAVLPLIADRYQVLNTGSALGRGVGPLLIKRDGENADVNNATICIPGMHTTAHLLFSLAYPDAKNKYFARYDEVEDFVAQGKGLGVIIHENRFTYMNKGLEKITDLGDYWEQTTGNPIPLGGIVVKRSLPEEMKKKIGELIGRSLAYSYENYPALSTFIKENAQEMSEDVMRKHIDLYVNEYSKDLGDTGRSAIETMMKVYDDVHGTNTSNKEMFIGG